MKCVYIEYTNGKDFDRYDAVTNVEVRDTYVLITYLITIPGTVSQVIIPIDPSRIKKIDILKYSKAEEGHVINTMKNVSVEEHFEGEENDKSK